MSMWRKTMVYLGLVEEEDDQHVQYGTSAAQEAQPVHDPFDPNPGGGDGFDSGFDVQPRSAQRDMPTRQAEAGQAPGLAPVAEPGGSHVRPMGSGMAGARVQVVAVRSFDEGAEEIGRQYRMGIPVLFDVTDTDASTARRMLDFVSGVTFALRGRMTKAGSRAFLIVPEGVELSVTERERLATMGYGGVG